MVKLIVWSKTCCALLCRLPEQESPPCMVRIGRRRHPHRSTQTSASVGADVLIGGYGIPAIPTQPPHAIRTQSPHATPTQPHY
ncbi:hypothetical protein [Leyella stercorea]|uniref:hypothetical protein n=1 Tax=Leyella stercorea TaxID=363265 RepID=UPI0026DD8253|nr:hypothetical protein [Leyella stercorea]